MKFVDLLPDGSSVLHSLYAQGSPDVQVNEPSVSISFAPIQWEFKPNVRLYITREKMGKVCFFITNIEYDKNKYSDDDMSPG